MSTTASAWPCLLFLLFCLNSVCSEKLEFLKIPPSAEIVAVGANLTINCTTNNQTAQTAVYYRRRTRSKWKKIEANPGKVILEGSVYTLVAMTRNNKGQYQCRAWGNTNSTETRWPESVGKILVLGGLDKGPRKRPDSKIPRNKRPGPKTPKVKKLGPKKQNKRPGNKNKRPDKRRKPPGQKPRPGSKKKPGRKRGGGKKPGRKHPGSKGPGKKRPGLKKSSLKVSNSTVVIEGSPAVLKCTAQIQGRDQPIIIWYDRLNRQIGCSDKKSRICTSRKPKHALRYQFTYKVRTSSGGNRKRLASHLKIPKTSPRDRGVYVCEARNKQGLIRRTIRLRIKKRSSS